MSKKKIVKKTSDASKILEKRYFKGKPGMEALVSEEKVNADIARQIYDLRTNACLTQRQLAQKVGTTASVINRLENADYEGHSLSMLKRIASTLEHKVEVKILPLHKRRTTSKKTSISHPLKRTDKKAYS